MKSLETYPTTQLYEKNTRKTDILAVIKNYNFCDRHTHIHTYGLGDSMTDPAQRVQAAYRQHLALSSFLFQLILEFNSKQ